MQSSINSSKCRALWLCLLNEMWNDSNGTIQMGLSPKRHETTPDYTQKANWIGSPFEDGLKISETMVEWEMHNSLEEK